MSNPIINMAMNFMQQRMQSDPRFAGNQMAQEFMDILKSGDATRGAQMADNICQSYGVSREDALKQSRQYFRM